MGSEPEQPFPPFDRPSRSPRTRLERSYDEDTSAEGVLEEAAAVDSPRQKRLMEDQVEEEEEEEREAADRRPETDYVANVDEKESSKQQVERRGLEGEDSGVVTASTKAQEALGETIRQTWADMARIAREMKAMSRQLKDKDTGKIVKPEDDPATMI